MSECTEYMGVIYCRGNTAKSFAVFSGIKSIKEREEVIAKAQKDLLGLEKKADLVKAAAKCAPDELSAGIQKEVEDSEREIKYKKHEIDVENYEINKTKCDLNRSYSTNFYCDSNLKKPQLKENEENEEIESKQKTRANKEGEKGKTGKVGQRGQDGANKTNICKK